jgi:predicted amidohydrolase
MNNFNTMMDLKITLIQSDLVWEDPQKNLGNFSRKLSLLKNIPDLILLPEMFNTGFTMNVKKCAEDMHGKTVQWLYEKASALNCVLGGSLLIKEDKRYFNRFIWMRPDGTFETYDKRHLFRMVDEHLTMSQGTVRQIVGLNGWNINLQICYDLRFPCWSRNSFANGQYEYDAMIYISNWPEIRSSAYKSLLPARAIENQAYIIWVNRIGLDGNNIYHSGDSMVIDPVGKILSNAKPGEEEIVSTSLSMKTLIAYRKKFTFGLDWDKVSVHH